MKRLLAAMLISIGLAGCASGGPTTREKATLGGAAVGAGTGAIVGAAAGGKPGTGALIGGALGAVTGALLGDQLQKLEREKGAGARAEAGAPASAPVVASRPAGDPTKGELTNATPWVVRVWIDPADPNQVEESSAILLQPNAAVPYDLDVGTHRVIARALVNTQFGERLVGRFDRTIQIDPRRPGWFLKFQETDFR